MAAKTIATPAVATAATLAQGSNMAYVQCQNLKYNAIIVGWLGIIISTVIISSSMLVIHMEGDIELLFKDVADQQHEFLMNLLTIFSTCIYGLSLINLGVNLLLLIGVARDSSGLLYPWLILHGVTFGFALYLAVFYAITGLFIDLSSFLMCLLVFALVLVIFYKIYHEIFTLFRVMQQQSAQSVAPWHSQQLEPAWASGMPYTPIYMPRMALAKN
ncbi:CG13747 [Drosophila busckii]|uniref:CG13747 n=1 Tax=Drosophila busckii TaxID=30019 RepID=A0A0M4EIA2_DROBS|nr:uncharacterized protein LOC108597595 [Drosophila busckii]ALC40780.1 CG13747 [Drosophila busckii]